MIKLIMLTGFLGSGKTTLLQKLIDEYAGSRTGILINEFGAVSVDSDIIRRDGLQMTELSNGSIFCACIKDKFVDALIELSGKDLDYLFIEASGLADPANMNDILEGIAPRLERGYEYLHSFCVIDGSGFMDLLDVLESLRHQVSFSDIVILNKRDLITDEQEEEIRSAVLELNPKANIIPASYCDIDIRSAMDSPSGIRKDSEESSNTFAARPVTVILKERQPVNLADLMDFINGIAGSTYRIKGFLNTDKGMMKLDCVGTDISVEPWNGEVTEVKAVVISSVGIRIVSVVTQAMMKYTKGNLTL